MKVGSGMDHRFIKQEKFQPIGVEGQRRLRESTVAIIGCGALGSSAADTLARAGVGTLLLVDRDYVEVSNLHRQPLYTEKDAIEMIPKVEAAKKRLQQVNSHVCIETIIDHADGEMIESLVRRCDIVVDGTDNFETRLIINDACIKHHVPWVYGACIGGTSVIKSFHSDESACFRCLLPTLPATNETCDSFGVIAPAVHITSAYQCAEVLKWLSGNRDAMIKELVRVDVWANEQHQFGIEKMKRPDCPACGENRTYPALQRSTQLKSAVLCGRDTVQLIPAAGRTPTLDDVEKVAVRHGLSAKRTPYFVQMEYNGYRLIMFANGRLLFHGLHDVNKANTMYHQLFG